MDHFITDRIALTPEYAFHMSEKLLYMPNSVIGTRRAFSRDKGLRKSPSFAE